MAEPLGNVVLQLGLDNAKFGSELKRTQQLVKYATAEMKAEMLGFGKTGSEFDKLSTKSRGLSRVIEAQEKRVQALKKAYDESFSNGRAGRNTAQLATQLQNATGKLNALNRQYVENARLAAKARIENEGFTGQINKISNYTSNAGKALSNVGSKINRFTAPVTLGLGTAVKLAVDFDSQIQAMGPLLTNGGKITAQYRAQLDQLSESSKTWASQTGISTTIINDAMSEMIKRGYSAQQVMGSMPAVLDASIASGEDLGTVMQATTSIVEQFGLKSNSTAEMMKNTQRVTDSLTYAANATSAGFEDMSVAMSYAGPVAKSLGWTVEETAAAVGTLSNMGIEGQKAGTGLRGVMTSLIKPTKAASSAFAQMGIDSKRLKADSANLPQLLDDITKGTKGMSKAERGRLLAIAFGRENQAAMNALLEAGSGELRKLTKETEAAGGATKKVADQISKTKRNELKRTVENIKQMGISIGQDLLPLLPPLLKDVNDLINAFNRLDSRTKENIIRWIALTAAAGPAFKLLGGGMQIVGGLGKSIIGLSSKIAQLRAAKAATDSIKGLNAATTLAGSSALTATGSVEGLGASFLSSTSGAGILTAAMSPLGLGVIGVTAALGLGAFAWEKWGKQAAQSANENAKWGTTVGKAADDSLEHFKNLQTQATNYLDKIGPSAEKSGQKVVSAFSKMSEEIEKNFKKQNKSATDYFKDLPEAARKAAKSTNEARKSAFKDEIKDSQNTAKQVAKIYANASKEKRALTDEEVTFIANAQNKMSNLQIQSLGLTAKKQKQMLAALNGDIKNLSGTQLSSLTKSFGDYIGKQTASYTKQTKALKQALKDGFITQQEYNSNMNQLEAERTQNLGKSLSAQYQAHVKYMKENGKSSKEISETWKSILKSEGLSVKEANKIMDEYAEKQAKTSTIVAKSLSSMSEKQQKAADHWNSLIWDEKNAKVKSNAQEEVNKAAQSEQGWKDLKFDLKNAKLSTNAKEMIGIAALENGKWESLSWSEKKAIIKSNATETIVGVLESSGKWNDLTLNQKEALITSKGGIELADNLSKLGLWNALTPAEKAIVIKDDASRALFNAVSGTNQWNSIPANIKKILATDLASPEAAKAIVKYKLWDSLPEKVKKLLGNNKQVSQILADAGIKLDKYDKKNPRDKHLKGESSSTQKAANAGVSALQKYDAKNPKTKKLMGKDGTTIPANAAISSINRFEAKKDSKRTFTSVFRTIIEKITKHSAKGSKDYEGGPTYVNDQKGPKFREAIILPNGETFIPEGRDVLLNLPRHSKIIPAAQTEKYMNQGFNNFDVPFDADVFSMPTTLTNNLQRLTPGNDNKLLAQLVDYMSKLTQPNNQSAQQNNPDQIVINLTAYGDLNESTARKWAEPIAVAIEQARKRTNAMGGA